MKFDLYVQIKNPRGRVSRKNPCDICGQVTGMVGAQAGRVLTCRKAHTHAMCAHCHLDVLIPYVMLNNIIILEQCPTAMRTADKVVLIMARRM